MTTNTRNFFEVSLNEAEVPFILKAIDFTLNHEWFWQVSPNAEAFGPVNLKLWQAELAEGPCTKDYDADMCWLLFRLCSDFTAKGRAKASKKAVAFFKKNEALAAAIAEKVIPVIQDRRHAEPKARKAKKVAKATRKTTRQPKAAAPSFSKADLLATLIRQNQQIIELLQAA